MNKSKNTKYTYKIENNNCLVRSFSKTLEPLSYRYAPNMSLSGIVDKILYVVYRNGVMSTGFENVKIDHYEIIYINPNFYRCLKRYLFIIFEYKISIVKACFNFNNTG